jgi:hypothetical protein
MEFNPAIHTKEFLMANTGVEFELAVYSSDFAVSELVNDAEILGWLSDDDDGNTVAHCLAKYQPQWLLSEASKDPDILCLKNNNGWSVAHILAEYQDQWLSSDAANNYDILRLADENGLTVAHCLATEQPQWLSSDAAKDHAILQLSSKNGRTVAHILAEKQSEWIHAEATKKSNILRLTDDDGATVAHTLAEENPQWITSDAAKDPDILRLADKSGWTVAYCLVRYQSECIQHEPIFRKGILTLKYNGKLLAQSIADRYAKSHGMDITVMAMKLITQGAAYLHSESISSSIGEKIFIQAKEMIECSAEPLVAFKQLQALYSTFYHQIEVVKTSGDGSSLDEWQSMLVSVEGLLAAHLNANPELFEVEHTIDIFCEPGDELFKRLASERALKSHIFSANDIEPPATEINAGKGLY